MSDPKKPSSNKKSTSSVVATSTSHRSSSSSSSSSSSEVVIERKDIPDIESLVVAIVADTPGLAIAPARYSVVGAEKADNMLSWASPPEIQQLAMPPLARIGTVGDGNCMLHSILFATSATYRAHNAASRSTIADAFREVLIEREEELKDLADAFFFEIGGAMGLEESFEILHGEREEINLELGLLIARLYGYNFLAVQVQPDLTMRPVRLTMTNRDDALPTIAVNYIGGGLNFGHADFQEGGHYEVIISATFTPEAAAAVGSSSSEKKKATTKGKRKTKKAKKPLITRALNEHDTEYLFPAGSDALMGLLAMFAVSSEKASSQGGGGRRRLRRLTKRRKPARR